MPAANKELRISRINFQDNYTNLAINPQTFETIRNLTIYAKNRNAENRLLGILLHDERAKEYSITITSETGNIVTENSFALLYMENGTVQKYNYSTKKSEILHFDNYVFNLSDNDGEKEKMRWKAKERYFSELINPNDDSDVGDLARYRAEINQRLTYPLLPIVFSIIALACILKGSFNRRGNVVNIVLAIIMATIFLILTILSYSLIEASPKFVPLLYANFATFITIGLYFLISNHRRKNEKNK